MKNVSKDGVVKRVDDIKAEKMVRTEGWKYVPKKLSKK